MTEQLFALLGNLDLFTVLDCLLPLGGITFLWVFKRYLTRMIRVLFLSALMLMVVVIGLNYLSQLLSYFNDFGGFAGISFFDSFMK